MNLAVVHAFPAGRRTQVDVVPASGEGFKAAVKTAKWKVVGPKKAFVIEGDDRVGAPTEYFAKLGDAKINLTATSAIVVGAGRFGAILWVKPRDVKRAAKALGVGEDTGTANHVSTLPRDYLRRRPGAPLAEVWEDTTETPAWPGRSTVAHAQLFAGDWKAAHMLASRDRSLGWSSTESAQGLVATVFLVLLSGKRPEALPRNLRELWRWALGNSIDVVMRNGEDHERLRDRLDGAYAQTLSLAADEQARLLTWCQRVTQARVNAIVGHQHRGSYAKAAVLLAACAEVLRLREKPAEADALADRVRRRFHRHHAFQRELNAALRRIDR